MPTADILLATASTMLAASAPHDTLVIYYTTGQPSDMQISSFYLDPSSHDARRCAELYASELARLEAHTIAYGTCVFNTN